MGVVVDHFDLGEDISRVGFVFDLFHDEGVQEGVGGVVFPFLGEMNEFVDLGSEIDFRPVDIFKNIK